MAEATLELIQKLVEQNLQETRAIRRVVDGHTHHLARIEREVANLHQDWASQSVRMDNLSDRLDRIERRLELVEA